MTGIVGPNGCGKSNLVEALRWVMGETSAKQMRGSGMEDVIFGGTANRPQRNIAEVLLSLDNAQRSAPAQFNDSDELEVSRRIEREKGSTYRVNSKETRARDVQLLFADTASGARSTALVSQGKIGALINAKPAERRGLLEEAAGITGLHSRRHEAELRLRGAESNLERLDDILVTLDAQMSSLKKQSRQATRYRNLSDHIRKAEATLFHLRWLQATGELERHQEELKAAEEQVNELTALTANASAKQAEEAAKLPELRELEAAAAAELHRLTVAREGLDAEEERVIAAQNACKTRLDQIATDSEREKSLAADARAANDRLEQEKAEIEASRQGETEAREKARADLDQAREAVQGLENEVSTLTEELANLDARRSSLTRTLADVQERIARLNKRAEEIRDQRARLEAETMAEGQLKEVEEKLVQVREAQEKARSDAEGFEADRIQLTETANAAVSALHEAKAALTELTAEETALSKLLASSEGSDLWPNIVDSLTVDAGFETALGAAIGDDLLAPADEAAPVHWQTMPPFDQPAQLPVGAKPLNECVTGPAALNRRLSQIGVVDDEEAGNRLARGLVQGQRLVSRDGALWRWDGYRMSAGAPTAAAARLEQKNRLADVRKHIEEEQAKVQAAENKATEAREASVAAQDKEREARNRVREADGAARQVQDELNRLKDKVSGQVSRLAALKESMENVEGDLNEAKEKLVQTEDDIKDLPDSQNTRDQLSEKRQLLAEKRSHLVECQSKNDNLTRLAEERSRRLQSIHDEALSWTQRSKGAAVRLEELESRKSSAEEELEKLSKRPAEIEAQRKALLDSIAGSEEKRKICADTLAEAESRLAEADRALRTAEGELARVRENRVRIEGAVEQSKQACESIKERVAEKLDATPEQLPELAELNEGKELPELEAMEKRVERLNRERETMGPVNLRAEQETRELTEQIESLDLEKGDLLKAIDKLRQGINELNREGRERLLASFHAVNDHFKDLFTRLFGGGKAHLELTDADDPLEAGLEIMASPPGKKMQVLSLLSGGEQALTALSLLFAVFLTNPAPICVLDEVDAPLDDANVDRFCKLLDEMASTRETRFLVITHHRMTMARMDRLFGVTMSERGVSQLVSVDLQKAEEIKAIA